MEMEMEPHFQTHTEWNGMVWNGVMMMVLLYPSTEDGGVRRG